VGTLIEAKPVSLIGSGSPADGRSAFDQMDRRPAARCVVRCGQPGKTASNDGDVNMCQ
jgi:hypothetical protein